MENHKAILYFESNFVEIPQKLMFKIVQASPIT